MSKSVLVVETPKNCLHCDFCIRSDTESECKLDHALDSFNKIPWPELDKKPGWCPLKKVPNEIEPDSHGYNAGWNDCVRYIVKE